MKNKLLRVLGLAMLVGCMVACGAEDAEQKGDVTTTESTDEASVLVYEFETFDGVAVVLDNSNIVSQETCETPFEWDGLPADAEQVAPGRDCVLLANESYYYVEDDTNKLVTTAVKEVGDVVDDANIAIFDNDVYSFVYNPEYFAVAEVGDGVTVSFYNEEIQTAGSNTITFRVIEKADAMEVARGLASQYGVDESSVSETVMGEGSATAYSFSVPSTGEAESGNATRSMACAVVCGDDVIAIEVLSHVEEDEGMDMLIADQISAVLDTFKID